MRSECLIIYNIQVYELPLQSAQSRWQQNARRWRLSRSSLSTPWTASLQASICPEKLKVWCITSGVQCTSNNFYVLAFTFEYTASNSALSSRMAATSLAKSPPSLMKFFRSSNPVFPFLEVVLCRSSPLDLLLGIKLIFDITFLHLTNSPPSLVSVSLEF